MTNEELNQLRQLIKEEIQPLDEKIGSVERNLAQQIDTLDMKIEAGLRGVRTEAKEQFQTLYTGQQDIVHLVKDIAEAAATQEQVDKHEERIERIEDHFKLPATH